MGRWSGTYGRVCFAILDEVMREADANDTSRELGVGITRESLWVSPVF